MISDRTINDQIIIKFVTVLVVLFQGKRISKFGFKTVSTGTVTVKLNIMLQDQ